MKMYNLTDEIRVDNEVYSVRNVWRHQPIFQKMSEAYRSMLDLYAEESRNGDKIINPNNIPNNINRIFHNNFSLIVEFSKNDFINENSYRGAQKLFKANRSTPQYLKRYWGKSIGMVHSIGFKIVDYDISYNVLAINNTNGVGLKFVNEVLVPKMRVEFPPYPDSMYKDEYDINVHIENRGWLKISNLTPQEKIVLANKYGVDPFPNSLYENDRGSFQRRVIQDEYDSRLENMTSDVDIRDYMGSESESPFEIVDKIIEQRETTLNEARDGFDYGDYQEFSDLYTRTKTQLVDYELYPIRVNCLPKAIRKKGKSPYDTKLGVREWRYFNVYQKPRPLNFWKNIPEVKEMMRKKEEKQMSEGIISDDIWAEIEMAYQMR